MLLFKDTFVEQRDFFIREWDGRAKENKRPAIFIDDSLPGLARPPKRSPPPLPRSTKQRQRTANEVLRVARARMHKIDVTQKLTLADCVKIAAEVDAEMANV